MIFPFMLLGPDLVAQKIGLVELKVGQKMGSWFKFLSLSFFLSLANYFFPLMRLGPGLVPLKLGLPNSKVCQKTGKVVWLMYQACILVLFFF